MRISDGSSDVCSSDLEAGILLAHHRDGRLFEHSCEPAVRSAVDRGDLAFLDVVRDLGVQLRLDALRVFARWITPPIMPKRFDTFFYVVHAPANQVAACDGHETVDAEWIAPRDVFRLAGSGERTVDRKSVGEGRSGVVRVDLGG